MTSHVPTQAGNAQTRGRNLGKVLIVDDETAIREVLELSLSEEGYRVETVGSGEAALAKFRSEHFDLVFLDIWMPGGIDGLEVLAQVVQTNTPDLKQTEFIVMSGHGTIETAVRAVKMGARDFIEKPLSMDRILILAQNSLALREERAEKASLLARLRQSVALVGDSPSMIDLKTSISKAAAQSDAVLIQGETGTGRHLVAQNLHYMSTRASQPLVEIQVSRFPDELQVGELFGFSEGSFAGVEKLRKGRIELAGRGAVVLDDVAELTLESQARLLAFLQSGRVIPYGSELLTSSLAAEHKTGTNDVGQSSARIIAMTRFDLKERVASGAFMPELLQMLSRQTMQLQPLRKRPIDVPALVHHFSDLFAREGGFKRKRFSDAAIELLLGHQWMGNVRELRNFIERIYILTPADFVDVHDIRFAGLNQSSEETLHVSNLKADATNGQMTNFREARARFEREYLVQKIAENKGNVSRTAEAIGLERSYLHRKIKAYGIEIEERST